MAEGSDERMMAMMELFMKQQAASQEQQKQQMAAMTAKLDAVTAVAAANVRQGYQGRCESALANSTNFSSKITSPAVRVLADMITGVSKNMDAMSVLAMEANSQGSTLADAVTKEYTKDGRTIPANYREAIKVLGETTANQIEALLGEGTKLFRALAQGVFCLQRGNKECAQALSAVLGDALPGEKGTAEDAMVRALFDEEDEDEDAPARGKRAAAGDAAGGKAKRASSYAAAAATSTSPKCAYCENNHYGPCFKWNDDFAELAKAAPKEGSAEALAALAARKPALVNRPYEQREFSRRR